MYRIARECLTNVVTHSEASKVAVRVVMTLREMALYVEDDGKGFEASQVPENRYGLVGINERARLLGGKMSLETGMGTGTRISVRIPL